MKTSVLFFLLLLAWLPARSQVGKVLLKNPSFEDEPKASHVPQDWFYYGPSEESPPDVQPEHYGCTTKPLRGNTYLGMVTRDNGTTESVGQNLAIPLLADSVYDFSVCLATARRYESFSRLTGKEANYSDPVRLRIWGINLEQAKKALLAESPVVSNHEWIRYRFEIRPPGINIDALLLEAWYGMPQQSTNGNLLLDNCSAFVPKFIADSNKIAESVFKPKPLAALRLIELYNPSFELAPVYFLPFGWEDTAGEITSWVRTHPYKKPKFRSTRGVYVQVYSGLYVQYPPTEKRAAHGERHLSLLASELKKRQQVSQRLTGLLKRDSTYKFSLHMARSKHFWENLTPGGKQVDFKNPLRLRIWGSMEGNPNAELLAESPSVVSTDWRKFDFVLQPLENDYDWITLEAWYVSDFSAPYNGNILLDNLSNIEMLGRD